MIATETVEANLDVLKHVLLTLKAHGFELNHDKCKFLRQRIEYLGYTIASNEISISQRHTKAIEQFPRPRNILEVQRFLGLANYFRKFIKDFSIKTKPLRELLRKTIDFKFTDFCINAFENLKKELTSFPVLALYNPSAETQLHTDTSVNGLGGILLQKQSSGDWKPVAYFSQPTNQAERNYHSFELEMLAIVRSIERFHIYLYGLKFTVITDCNALVYAVTKANLNPRIARWTLALQNYTFDVRHRAGERMAHVDALSRAVNYVDALPLERELEFRQLKDAHLQSIAKELEFSDSKKFELIDGLIYRKDIDRPRFVIPEAMVTNIIRVYHDEMAHCGIEKTIQGIANTYWFPGMRRKVADYVDNCLTCITSNLSSHSKEGELQIEPMAREPFTALHIDHFGPLQTTGDGYRHIFVVIDSFTRFTWFFPTKTTSTKEVNSSLKGLFNIFGSPQEIISDRGTAFTSSEFQSVLNHYSIKHRLIAVASPWANGMVERVNRFIKSSLKKIVATASEWKDSVVTVQYVLNNTYHSSIKNSPSKIFFGYDRRNHSDKSFADLVTDLSNIDIDLLKQRDINRDIATEASQKLREYNKQYYDKRHIFPTKYRQGDYVMIRKLQAKPGENTKLRPPYKGPYLIAETLKNNRYVVTDVPGFNRAQRPYKTVLSPDKIKPWIRPIA